MSMKSNLLKAAGLGVVITALTVGASFAATATGSVNVRSGPGTSYGVVDHLWPGEHVRITGRSNGWCEVSKPGPDGWVSCAYLAGGNFDRFNRFDRFDQFGFVGPTFGFPAPSWHFGFRGPGAHFRPHTMGRHQAWWW